MNNENNKESVKAAQGNVNHSFTDLIHFKDDFLKTLFEFKADFTKQTSSQIYTIEKKLKEMTSKTSDIEEKVLKLIHSTTIDTSKIEKIDDILITTQKATNTLMAHEVKINTIEKDISNACYKYDKIFIDNLSIPGKIGDYCKFKNLREYIFNNDESVNSLTTLINKSTMDLKSYKKKIEALIQQFNFQITSFKDSCVEYTNTKIAEAELKKQSENDEIYSTIERVKIENAKYSMLIKKQTEILHKDIEDILGMKKEINETMYDTLKKTEQMDKEVLSEFDAIKQEFKEIKGSIIDLASFLKNGNNTKDSSEPQSEEERNKLKNDLITNFNQTLGKLIRQAALEKAEQYSERIHSSEMIGKEIESCVKKYINGKIKYNEVNLNRRKTQIAVSLPLSMSNSPRVKKRKTPKVVNISELNLNSSIYKINTSPNEYKEKKQETKESIDNSEELTLPKEEKIILQTNENNQKRNSKTKNISRNHSTIYDQDSNTYDENLKISNKSIMIEKQKENKKEKENNKENAFLIDKGKTLCVVSKTNKAQLIKTPKRNENMTKIIYNNNNNNIITNNSTNNIKLNNVNNENKNINSNINYHLQNNKYFTGREVKTVITSSSPKVNDDKIKIKSRLNYRASKLGLSSNDECIKTPKININLKPNKRCFSSNEGDTIVEDVPLIPTYQTNFYSDLSKSPIENRIIEFEFFTKKKFDELVSEIKQFLPIKFNSHIRNYSVVVDKQPKYTFGKSIYSPSNRVQTAKRPQIKQGNSFTKKNPIEKENKSPVTTGDPDTSTSSSKANLIAFRKYLNQAPKHIVK